MGLDTLPAEVLQQVLRLVFRGNWLKAPDLHNKLNLRLVCKYVDQNIRQHVFSRIDIDHRVLSMSSDMSHQMVIRLLFEIARTGAKSEIGLLAAIRRTVQFTLHSVENGLHNGNVLCDKYCYILCCITVANLKRYGTVLQLGSKHGYEDVSDSEDHASALAVAAYDDDLSLMNQLLNGLDIKTSTHYFATALHWAAYRGHIGPVNLMLVKGAQVMARDWQKRTPLHLAALQGHSGVVSRLLDTNAAKDDTKDDAFFSLFSAPEDNYNAEETSPEPAEPEQAVAIDADAKDSFDRTPLSLAAEGGHEAVLKLLLGRDDVDPGSKTRHGCTPLLWAVKGGHVEVVKQLLASPRVMPQAPDLMGQTPLLWAAKEGQCIIFKLLLERKKVKADAKDKRGRSPLSWAAAVGAQDIVNHLLMRGNVDVESKDDQGRTPLFYAMEAGHEQVVKLLLAQEGVNSNPLDKYGDPPEPYTLLSE